MGSCLSIDGGNSNPNSPRSPSLGFGKYKRNSRRKEGSGSSSKGGGQLHRIPGRMCSNGATDVASLFTQQGKKGTNQDAMIVWENFGSREDTIFCGIFDGHGPNGHKVAKRVRDSLPVRLSIQWEASIGRNDELSETGSARQSMNSDETDSLCIDDESVDSLDIEDEEKLLLVSKMKKSYVKAFKVMDKELRLQKRVNCFCSGTTAVTVVKQGQELVIGNLGDSRAILGTRDEDHSLIAVQLTVDLKPNLPREASRIRQCRGRIFALPSEPDVARVWLPNDDAPGLAMARAFGDFCVKKYGVISTPVVSHRRLTEKDEFVVLATDGVWDVLSNQEVVDIVSSAPTRSSAARALVESAVRSWKIKYPTSNVDDCAVVCLFLNSTTTATCSSSSSSVSKSKIRPLDHVENNENTSDAPATLDRSGTTVRTCTADVHLEPNEEREETLVQQPEGTSGLVGDEKSGCVSRLKTVISLPKHDFDE